LRSFLTAAIFTPIKWNCDDVGGDGSTSFRPNTQRRNNAGQNVAFLVIKKWMWLLVTLFFAACSMLTKEHGITVLAVCAIYDVFVQSRLKPKDLFSSVVFQVN
jgi:hypothetical protein